MNRTKSKIDRENERNYVNYIDNNTVVFKNPENSQNKTNGVPNNNSSFVSNDIKNEIKADDNGGILPPQQTSHEFRIVLTQARCAKKLNQAQLAQQLNIQVSFIRDWENGKATPTGPQISKLQRILTCKLPKIDRT